jgi:putative hemolysin
MADSENSDNRRRAGARLRVKLAHSQDEVRASQRLRYRVFAEEMGATVHSEHPGEEADHYDPYCQHLMVWDEAAGRVISSTRILTGQMVKKAGGFYSEGEFDLSRVLRLPGNFIEIGRTCVDPDFRSGAAIGMLWAGLAQFIDLNRIDYLIGCASIPMTDGGATTNAIMAQLRARHMAPEHLRVTPRKAVPLSDARLPDDQVSMPPLLKAYLRVGAWVCGEPCWDPDFGVADVFVLLDVDNLQERYVRHFMNRSENVQRSDYALAS